MSQDAALAGLEAEIGRLGSLFDGLGAADWSRPTRCPPMTVHGIGGHLLRQADQIAKYPRGGDGEEKDAVAYYRYDPADIGDAVVARAVEMAASVPPAAFPADWHARWTGALRVAREDWESNPVVRSPLGQIRLQEYVRTRCVEACVHHMDLCDALGRVENPDSQALDVTAGVLEGLLGSPRPPQMDPVDFVLSGTGRRALTDSERDALGPGAGAFPLLS